MPKMVEVVIDSVRVSLTNQQRVVVLRELNTDRYLPIWIGPYEAEAITIALQEVEVARPQTHDLLKNTLHALNARLVRVEVISLREEVFYGNLVVETNGRTVTIDSRPSDALALAARAHVPILVDRDVLDTAGIIPEQETSESEPESAPEEEPEAKPETHPETGSAEERLSVFEDFLDKLDLDNLDKPTDASADDSEEDDKPKKQ
jgi:uncharacterized protein